MPEHATLNNPAETAPPTSGPAGAAGANGDTPLDLQRSALRDLVALSTESATTESEIERAYQTATEQGQKDFEKTTWTIRQRYDGMREAVKNKHREALASVDAKFQRDTQVVEAETVPRVAKLDRDHESLEHNVTKNLNHALWLAESVCDVAGNQAREEYKKARERTQTHDEALAALDAQAFATLQRYSLPPTPAPADAPAVEKPEQSEAEFETRRAVADRQLEALRRLKVPQLFVGPRAYFLGALITVGAAAVVHWRAGMPMPPDWKSIGIAAGIALVVSIAAL